MQVADDEAMDLKPVVHRVGGVALRGSGLVDPRFLRPKIYSCDLPWASATPKTKPMQMAGGIASRSDELWGAEKVFPLAEVVAEATYSEPGISLLQPRASVEG